jgi:hypothetical protein
MIPDRAEFGVDECSPECGVWSAGPMQRNGEPAGKCWCDGDHRVRATAGGPHRWCSYCGAMLGVAPLDHPEHPGEARRALQPTDEERDFAERAASYLCWLEECSVPCPDCEGKGSIKSPDTPAGPGDWHLCKRCAGLARVPSDEYGDDQSFYSIAEMLGLKAMKAYLVKWQRTHATEFKQSRNAPAYVEGRMNVICDALSAEEDAVKKRRLEERARREG